MLTLSAKVREATGKKTENIRQQGKIPAVLYGPKIKKNLIVEVDFKEFEKIFHETGESSLVSLKVDGKKEESLVLIHGVEKNVLTGAPIHVDFYQPDLEKEIEAKVPLVFIGEAPAIKETGGTLVRNISEVRVKAKPQNLPKEIKLSVDKLKTLEDSILIGDLQIPEGVKILRDLKDIVAFVATIEKVEEELAKPGEEKVEEVEKVKGKKDKEGAEEPVASPSSDKSSTSAKATTNKSAAGKGKPQK
ncbi:MAG: 50S ribosomal protein L25 [Candidatus Wildermuthbacteria bacterium]|nr:50S ribosomal protein L25 [Candidatus Wildermuthbacteria bacterium]